MPPLRPRKAKQKTGPNEEELGGQMSFLEHLDELRTRLIRSMIFVFLAAMLCWFVSDRIYNFLARPVQRALAEAQVRRVGIAGLSGQTAAEPLTAGNDVIPKDVRLPVDLNARTDVLPDINDKLVVTTALEPFALYVKVSLYTALALSVPFLLWQIWAFVAPGLYPHERKYVTPFIAFSSVGFVAGATTAYKFVFPPAAKYLLGLGQDFRLLLKADDYFDFIILLMLGMGIVFQMPAITYVLARIGLVTASWMLRVWRMAVIVILIAAAVLSPTNDVPNMLLFAAPMFILYVVSILVAWICGRKRRAA